MDPGLAITAAGAASLAVLGVAEALHRRLGWSAETTRRVAHVAMGPVVATFPWALPGSWAVGVLALGFAGLLALTRRTGLLRSVHGVERGGVGAVAYPVGVWAAARIGEGAPAVYLAGIGVLALGDGVAGWVGDRWGATHYDIGAQRRSVEGSVGMFIVSTGIGAAAATFGGLPPLSAGLAGLVVGGASAAVEGLSPRGTDNLLVPVAAAALLSRSLSDPASLPHDAAVALAAGAVAAVSLRRQTLSGAGALAAYLLGVVTGTAGWPWFAALLAVFVGVNLASRLGKGRKPLQGKGARRDHVQVFANAGVGGLCALGAVTTGHPAWAWGYLGAIGVAGADTLASELGVLARRPPVSITTGRPVPIGVSGGVTPEGYAAALLGGVLPAVGLALCGAPLLPATAGVVGGLVGCTADSVVGDTLQVRRRCACGALTEDRTHCNEPAAHTSGLVWMDNDAVNLVGSATGALAGFALWAWLGR